MFPDAYRGLKIITPLSFHFPDFQRQFTYFFLIFLTIKTGTSSNTEAVSLELRQLNNQPDYNRIWPGTELPLGKETEIALEIVNTMVKRKIFASIDIHNNTGLNPHYACITKLDNQFLQLTNLFGRLVAYFTRSKGVQCGAFAQICPAVTLECGKPGQTYGVEHAFEYLNSCLHFTKFSSQPVPTQDIDFSFNDESSNFLLSKDLEQMNFTEMPAGTQFGRIINHPNIPLTAIDEAGKLVTEQFLH